VRKIKVNATVTKTDDYHGPDKSARYEACVWVSRPGVNGKQSSTTCAVGPIPRSVLGLALVRLGHELAGRRGAIWGLAGLSGKRRRKRKWR
jgi:hypothetical protein